MLKENWANVASPLTLVWTKRMIIIAEISDKMSSISGLWAVTAAFTVPFLLGTLNRRVAWVLLPIALGLSGWIGYEAYHEAFVEVGMRGAIREEMGRWWIFNSISSSVLPALVATGVLVWQIRKTGSPNQAAQSTARTLAESGR